ncbi:MAG TPA: amylo-alpha-1,6-glucosidase [Candidatus Eisenbacteria bacterium]|nr:amylo-alpha-1,6-glucosidase [Candidatus Eisenbacteria bacterium]
MIEPIVFNNAEELRNREFLRDREWLVTNGLGGYASGTLLGVGTRRYHGLFIPNLPSPRGRTAMVPRLDDTVSFEDKRLRLSGAEHGGEKSSGHANLFLEEFREDWQTPVWTFAFAGRRFEKRIIMPYGQNTVYVQYRLLEGDPVSLELRPYVTCRMHDGLLGYAVQWPFTLTAARGRYEIRAFEGAPTLRLCLKPGPGSFLVEEKVSTGVYYRVEAQRGQESLTNLYSPGRFEVKLKAGSEVSFIASIESWDTLDCEPSHIFEAERKRLEKLLSIASKNAQQGLAARLVIAADQFIVLPWTRSEENVLHRASGERLRTIIAGYPWFTDWGRDTMISLEGLTLCTGRHYEAKAILQTFAHYVKDGLLPNHFPEGHRTAIYNTVDATFWYFHAIDRYTQVTGDKETVKALLPVLRDIIEQHVRGTQFGIYVDPRDSLVRASCEGFALTWMDAKVDEWVVTPRRGKPVEIQALWYNALKLMAGWSREAGEPSEEYSMLARKVQDSFNARFWFEAGQHLYDVIDGERGNDASLRPNQIFTMSLRHSVLDRSYWKPVLDAVAKKLLTPYGLRTLDPSNKEYLSRYEGDRWNRDAAYHQGMVWAWLIGPFLNAWMRVYRDRQKAGEMLAAFEKHLADAGIGSISEIFDGDAPFTPRGCYAQAWSVAEVLRSIVALKDLEDEVAATATKKEGREG